LPVVAGCGRRRSGDIIYVVELNRSAVVEYSSCVSLTFLNVNMS
jgi:hypothetical protein